MPIEWDELDQIVLDDIDMELAISRINIKGLWKTFLKMIKYLNKL